MNNMATENVADAFDSIPDAVESFGGVDHPFPMRSSRNFKAKAEHTLTRLRSHAQQQGESSSLSLTPRTAKMKATSSSPPQTSPRPKRHS
jgi:hypothetical protein